MINLWKYQDEKKIKIIDVDGNEFIGMVDEVTDSEEYPNKTDEDGITINIDGRLIEFMQSEIKTIEIIN